MDQSFSVVLDHLSYLAELVNRHLHTLEEAKNASLVPTLVVHARAESHTAIHPRAVAHPTHASVHRGAIAHASHASSVHSTTTIG